MKKRVILISGIGIAVLLVGIISFPNKFKSKVEIKSMGDDRGFFMGERRPQYKESDPAKWSPETRKRVERYEADVKAIEDAHKYRMEGYEFAKLGQMTQAADAFKKAYELERSADSAFLLAETYERLGRYDDAIAVLDNMVNNRETNEYGVEKASAMKARLVTSKSGTFVANEPDQGR